MPDRACTGARPTRQRPKARVDRLHRGQHASQDAVVDLVPGTLGHLDDDLIVTASAPNDIDACKPADQFLPGVDRPKPINGHASSGIQPTGEAWGRREVGIADSELTGDRTHTCLVDASVDVWMRNVMFRRRSKPGTVFREIVTIRAAEQLPALRHVEPTSEEIQGGIGCDLQ